MVEEASRGWGGGVSRCPMSIIRNGNVAVSNLIKCHVTTFLTPCCTSLRPRKGCATVPILGVHTHNFLSFKYDGHMVPKHVMIPEPYPII